MNEKRSANSNAPEIQKGNQSWWTDHTMSYDWNDRVSLERFSVDWYDEIDARFCHSSRLFATDEKPFDRLIPFEELSGKRALEIGCGMGFHSELLARSGAILSCVDLSPTSIEATKRRFLLKGLDAEIIQADAEQLPFENESFDFVWSWGVIHHSSRTAKIVREIARTTKKSGQCRIMVYNRSSVSAAIVFLKDHVGRLKCLTQDFDLTLLTSTDGYHARFYTSDQFADLLRAFFGDVSMEVMGQDADAIPLPQRLRNIALKFVPETWLKARQSKDGAFLFATGSNPF